MKPYILAITGGAGAGKTTLAEKLAVELKAQVYSIDYRFIGDSNYRCELLVKKEHSCDYTDARNQFNWWNWDLIFKDIQDITAGTPIEIEAAYNRESGLCDKCLCIEPAETLIIEGAILGCYVPGIADRIMFLTTPRETRFARLLDKDKGRRSVSEMLSRFEITETSEQMYYKYLSEHYSSKIEMVS